MTVLCARFKFGAISASWPMNIVVIKRYFLSCSVNRSYIRVLANNNNAFLTIWPFLTKNKKKRHDSRHLSMTKYNDSSCQIFFNFVPGSSYVALQQQSKLCSVALPLLYPRTQKLRQYQGQRVLGVSAGIERENEVVSRVFLLSAHGGGRELVFEKTSTYRIYELLQLLQQ